MEQCAWQGVKDTYVLTESQEGEYDQECNKINKRQYALWHKGWFKGKASQAVEDAEALLALNTDSRISLYLPRAIQIQDTVSYDNAFQLGLIGGAIEKGLSGGQEVQHQRLVQLPVK